MLARVAAVAAISLVPTAVAVAPAQAYGSCSISVPSKVSIYSPYREITAKFSAGCYRYAESAWWDVVHPSQGYAGAFHFDGSSTDTIDWYDWDSLGTYKVRGDFAYGPGSSDVAQNSTTMTVKLGSRTTASSTRSGRYVTGKGTARRYSPAAGGYRPWSGAKASLQMKSCSSCSWKYVKSGTTNGSGVVTMKAYASTSRYWRVVTSDTSSTWGRASSYTKR
ncbi:hypothetical protein [Janibacter melonis]|uniref:hypothetical protein n=1 Tax=Janibacter melonis TaxID=262209 RepID=UPI002095691C|nr:hypothetical protein [Janibacter melonis]